MEHGQVLSVPDGPGLASALAALPGGRGLVQPYLVGGQRTVDGLAWDGEVVAVAQKTGDRTGPATAVSCRRAHRPVRSRPRTQLP